MYIKKLSILRLALVWQFCDFSRSFHKKNVILLPARLSGSGYVDPVTDGENRQLLSTPTGVAAKKRGGERFKYTKVGDILTNMETQGLCPTKLLLASA